VDLKDNNQTFDPVRTARKFTKALFPHLFRNRRGDGASF
jgi:hypothetical protein